MDQFVDHLVLILMKILETKVPVPLPCKENMPALFLQNFLQNRNRVENNTCLCPHVYIIISSKQHKTRLTSVLRAHKIGIVKFKTEALLITTRIMENEDLLKHLI